MQTQEVDAKVQQITLSEQAVEQAKSEEEKVLTLLFLGSDYAKNGETDKAISTYEKILEFSPNNEKALAALSTTTYTAKYKEKAEYYLARLIEVIESNPESTSKKSLGLYRKMLTSAKSGEFKPLEEVGQE